jgi:glycosyltransferase involved in cell wall biosynthesis
LEQEKSQRGVVEKLLVDREAMSSAAPRVSIGLPVYNGETYLAEAIECIRAQTFDDFEVIISDNGSTDRTQQMCRDYVASDARFRYIRQPTNLGVARNFNHTFQQSRGEYFKWVAHDDLMASTFLEQTVAALDTHPEAVLSMPRVAVVNEEGRQIRGDRAGGARASAGELLTDECLPRRRALLESSRAHRRYLGVLVHSIRCYELFALIRADALRRTPQMRAYANAEKVLLAELALLGTFHEVPEALFFSRWHGDRMTNGDPAQKRQEHWSPQSRIRVVWPHQPRCALGYFLVPWQQPLSFAQRLACLGSFARFLLQVRRYGGILRGACLGKGMHVAIPRNAELLPRPEGLPGAGRYHATRPDATSKQHATNAAAM